MLEKTNAEGGILGCQVEFMVEEDGVRHPDLPAPVPGGDRVAGRYDVFIGPTNSGCMASLPAADGAAGKCSDLRASPLTTSPSSTRCRPEAPYRRARIRLDILEGRAGAAFAAEQGWKRPALMVPNYAYGQDVGDGFKSYYNQLVPDGQVVDEQFPEFDEDNFTPFINAMVGANPDGILTAFFSSFMLPFVQPVEGERERRRHPVISGLASLDSAAGLKSEADIPANCVRLRPRQLAAAREQPGRQGVHRPLDRGVRGRVPDPRLVHLPAALDLADGEGADRGDTVGRRRDVEETIEVGDFSFDGPYNAGPTYVNPMNHMGDTCAEVGAIVWDESVPIPASYDPDSFVLGCMHEVLHDRRKSGS